TAYDGLGRVKTATAGDLVTTPAYGTGGAQTGTSMQPADDSPYQGKTFTAEQNLDLSGGPLHKVLTQGEGEDAESRGGTRNVLDLAGRVRVQVDQLGNTTTLVHAKDGQIASSVTRTPGKDGQDGALVSKTSNTYDQATGRLVSTTVTDGQGTETTRSMRYDDLGRITEVWEGTPKDGQDTTEQYKSSVIGYGYDADGNTTSVTYPDGTTLTQAFDEAGRLVKSADAAGAVTDYTYHPETGRLEKAVQKAKDGTELATAAYTYDTLGRLESVSHGNKTTTRYEYFDNDQPKTQTLTRDDGGEVLARTAYTYNSHGNLQSRTDTRPAVTADGSTDTGAGNVTTHTVHTYDAYDRLIRTVLHDGDSAQGKLVKQTDYQINASGDVTHTKTTNADGTVSETVNEIDAAGRRTTVTTGDVKTEQTWDPAGNLTRDRHGTTITYNPDNKPTTLTPTQPEQATVAIAYWADGSRRSATTTDREGTQQTTTYHYTPTGTLANDTTGTLTASYLTTPHGREHRTLTQDGTPAPADDRAGTGYLHTDRRGNTLALVDHEGAVTDSYYYEDYGRPATHRGLPLTPDPQADRAHTNPIQYGGEYTNTWDHTQYTPARTYTPDGYFTTRDTYQLHNRHQAFGTNPIEYIDPTGHARKKIPTHGPEYTKPVTHKTVPPGEANGPDLGASPEKTSPVTHEIILPPGKRAGRAGLRQTMHKSTDADFRYNPNDWEEVRWAQRINSAMENANVNENLTAPDMISKGWVEYELHNRRKQVKKVTWAENPVTQKKRTTIQPSAAPPPSPASSRPQTRRQSLSITDTHGGGTELRSPATDGPPGQGQASMQNQNPMSPQAQSYANQWAAALAAEKARMDALKKLLNDE
ncbi:hypothetical protein ABT187_47335, partial [Streptomyces sp. NPDC001817]